MHARFAALVVAVVLGMASPPAGASPAFEAMLRQAEAVRSADPVQFEALLGQLNSSVGAASKAQREQLQYLKAYHLAFGGRYDLAVSAAKQLFEQTDDVQLKFRAGALIVNGLAITRETTEGLRYLDQTLALVDQVTDPELRHHGWSAAGTIYNQVGVFEQGKYFAELMLADNPSPRTRCFAGSMRLESLYNLGPLVGEEASIETLVQQCTDIGETVPANFARSHLARRMASRGERSEAILLLTTHLPDIEATRYPRLIAEIHALLAVINLDAGDRSEAERHANEAIDRSTGMPYSVHLVDAYRVLYESALQRGDSAEALAQHVRFAAADKAYLDIVKARELAYQMVRNETQQKSQTIDLLNKRNEVLQLERQVATQTARTNQLLIALLAVLLASIGFWAFRIKRLQVSLRKLAETDALTGISNRHHFSASAKAALDAARGARTDVALVMVDVDDFKAINDAHGHAVGDWALRQVALAGLQACRAGDLVGRLGGEEFALLLPNCDLARAASVAQDCRRRIAAIDTAATGVVFRLTASFGVAGSAVCGYELDALLARADDALYRSKREGRDRVSLHTADTAERAATSLA